MPMTPQTFVQRVRSVHGRQELHCDDELVVLHENFRDPLVNDALRDTCDRINRKGFAAMADGSVWPSSRRSHDATSSIDLISHF